MARMTRDRGAAQTSGQVRFNMGIAEYEQTETILKVTVRLENERTYYFELPNVVK